MDIHKPKGIPVNKTPRRTSGKMATLVVALLLLAVPASAAIFTQNFLQAEITAEDACFVKVAGGDTTLANSPASVVLTNTHTSSTSGLDLLQEQVQVTGYVGDRVTYTDVVQYTNTCAYDIVVELVAEADAAGNPAVDGTWGSMYAELYISNTPNAVASADLADGSWEGPIVVNAGTLGATTRIGDTGVTLSTGDFLTTAFMVEVDAGLAATPQTGVLRYTAVATTQ